MDGGSPTHRRMWVREALTLAPLHRRKLMVPLATRLIGREPLITFMAVLATRAAGALGWAGWLVPSLTWRTST